MGILRLEISADIDVPLCYRICLAFIILKSLTSSVLRSFSGLPTSSLGTLLEPPVPVTALGFADETAA